MRFYKIISIVLAVVISMSGCSAIGQPLGEKNTPVPTVIEGYTAKGVGSAKTLEGSCFIVNVFLSDDSSKWSDEDKHGALVYLENALEFLMSQADRYGKMLSFSFTDEDASANIKVSGELPNDSEGMNKLFSMMEESGMSIKRLEEKCGLENMLELYDNVFFLIFVNKQGRSYSLMYDSQYSDCEEFFSERSVLFYNTDRNYKYCANATVYAHEILHLFGAADMYQGSKNEDMGSIYEKDIMNKTPFDMTDVSIEAFTAFCVGLADTRAGEAK